MLIETTQLPAEIQEQILELVKKAKSKAQILMVWNMNALFVPNGIESGKIILLDKYHYLLLK